MSNKPTSYIFSKDYTSFITLIFFAVIIVLFTFPVGDGDYYWHVKTGQWIWQHKSLPASDPFSFTTQYGKLTAHAAQRIPFILKQYWLGQLAIYGTWEAAGEAGMVILRSAVYTGILAFIYRWLRGGKCGIIPLATVFMIGNVLSHYPNERPQLFAYAFMTILLFLLERLNKSGEENNKYHTIGLPLLMLVWANCHGSFILGIVVIVISLISYIVTSKLSGKMLNKKILGIMTGAVLASFINPSGYSAFSVFFTTRQSYVNTNTEFMSPLVLAVNYQVFDYYYWGLLIFLLAVIILRFRLISLYHLLLFLFLAAISLAGVRYIPFFVLAVPLAATYLPDWRPKGVFAFFPPALLLIWLATADYQNILKFRAEMSFPTQAVRFINTANPAGNIFNYQSWGGYLLCYSKYPDFIDGRGLNEDFVDIHNYVLSGNNWKDYLTYFQVNSIIIPGTDLRTGKAYPLLMQLSQDNGWALVYQDDVALVFAKNIPQNQELISRYAMSKSNISRHIMDRWKWQFNNSL